MTNVTNPDGSGNRAIQEPELLRSYLAVALNNAAQGEETFTPEPKAKIYELTTKLYKKKGSRPDARRPVLPQGACRQGIWPADL
jgi:hypothetical protein